jgi:hypothetical protein
MKRVVFFFIFFSFILLKAQTVYKTPSGKKYHLASCKMVENVSRKLIGGEDINKSRLTACKICKPPSISNIGTGKSFVSKAVGESTSVRCNGVTQKGTRCKHMTKLANGFCYQHTSQNKTQIKNRSNYIKSSSVSSTCGERTKAGGYCKRKVTGGIRCYQHR